MTSLQILTLNCWGVPVPFVCKNRHERMKAIGDHVSQSQYDIVVLQEVWKKSDYDVLVNKLNGRFPHAHYFYSGVIGSGVCVFSKAPILETLFFKFDLNGYPHNIHHGDYLGGKGVGLVVVDFQGFIIHVYATHIHAEYNQNNDQYLSHRVSQAFSISQFIRHTSQHADLSFLCGDLNLEPHNLGYKLIRTNAGLKDAWLEKKSTKGNPSGNTCDCPDNSFVNAAQLKVCPDGKRIDFILYRPGIGIVSEVEECSVTMGKIPGRSLNFSDHEGVEANFYLRKTTNIVGSKFLPDSQELTPLLMESLSVVDDGLRKVRSDWSFFVTLLLSAFLLFYLSYYHVPFPLDYFTTFLKMILTLLLGYCMGFTIITKRSEVHGLTLAKADMKIYLETLQKSA